MKPSDQRLKNFIRKGQSFILTGPVGCGKTYFIRSMFKQTNTKFITINCTLADTKANFIKLFNHQISRFLQLQREYAFKTSNVIDAWIRQFTNLMQQSNGYFKTCLQNTYILMDCIQELKMNQFFLMSFYKICQEELPIKLNFVFCGVYYGEKRYEDHEPFRKMIKFHMPRPQYHIVQKVTRQIIEKTFQSYKIKQKLQKNDVKIQNIQQCYQSGIKYLTNYLTQAFMGIQTDLNKIKRMSNIIVSQYKQEFTKPLKNNQNEQNQTSKSKVSIMKSNMFHLFLHTNKGIHGVQTVIQNEELPDDQIRTLMRQEKADVNIHNEKTEQMRFKRLLEKIQTSKNTFYPSLILASIHFADLFTQTSDYKRFMDHRSAKIEKSNYRKHDVAGPKHSVQRIIAISQAIQTAQQQPQTPQTQYFHHSLDYYSCFQHLRDYSLINFYGKMSTWGKKKILGRPNIIDIKNFLATRHLNYAQYTGEE